MKDEAQRNNRPGQVNLQCLILYQKVPHHYWNIVLVDIMHRSQCV